MKETKKNVFEEARKKMMMGQYKAEFSSALLERLESMYKDNLYTYEVIGKEEQQATHYSTGELLWEDEEKTIPRFRNIYGYVEIPEDKYTEEQRYKKLALDSLLADIIKNQ